MYKIDNFPSLKIAILSNFNEKLNILKPLPGLKPHVSFFCNPYTVWFWRQNPTKFSIWAREARAGKEVIQIVLKKYGKAECFDYLGVIVNREVKWY